MKIETIVEFTDGRKETIPNAAPAFDLLENEFFCINDECDAVTTPIKLNAIRRVTFSIDHFFKPKEAAA